MLIRHLTLLLILTLSAFTAFPQNGGYSLSRSFTVTDGLPSNHIYNIVEDDDGFLWISTDAGLARFNGKEFQIFTVEHGLPDNDVLDVVKENLPHGKKDYGRIWVTCFKQNPAYFDEVKNRFINAREDTSLAIEIGKMNTFVMPLKEGGVMYWNENGSYFFENGKFSERKYENNGIIFNQVIQKYNDGSFIAFGGFPKINKNYIHYDNFISYIKDGKIIESILLEKWKYRSSTNNAMYDNTFYLASISKSQYYLFSAFQINPLRYRVDTVAVSEPTIIRRFTEEYFYTIGISGKFFVFNRQTNAPLFEISGNYSPNCLFNDSKGNLWVGSIDKGLFMYKKSLIETFAKPDKFTNTFFLSIARKPNGALLAGNHFGQVAETDGKYFIVHSLPVTDGTNWVRKIIVSQNKVFTFSEGGSFINYKKPVLNIAIKKKRVSKTAVYFNDSIIIEGGHDIMSAIDTKREKISELPVFSQRTTCIAVAAGSKIYHGSIKGLYKYDFDRRVDDSLAKNHPLLAERITAICASPDSYVWVATDGFGLLALHKDSVVEVFTTANGIISNSIKCVISTGPGKIWIATNSGISIIRYSGTPANFTYQNLTVNDGLSNNIINEMLYSNDTVYCATGNGICAIPANISLPPFNIPVRLTSVAINEQDTSLAAKYDLRYNQKNIQLRFAGVELGGHLGNFEYRINQGNWLFLQTGVLSLQLNSGYYDIEIRAIDVNGKSGTEPMIISFAIATPFWKAIWFWLLVFLISVGVVLWFFKKREMYKRELALREILNQKKITELELLALKSQINPHFIFNCLNSIKLLSHQQKHAEAEKYLDRFAALLRSALEQSSLQQITLQQEIEFIENYLELEKLRMPDKLIYKVETTGEVNTKELLIPSMLLQPFIENAVKHGVAPLKNLKGLVQVKFYIKHNFLVAEVRDNGIGIGMGKKVSGTGRHGIGIENTARRSSLYNIETTVTDLQNVDISSSGTLVQLKIPVQKRT